MNEIKQKALEILASYILHKQLFIDYAGTEAVDLIMDFIDSTEFKPLKPIVEDIKYMIKDFVNDPDINPAQLEYLIDGMIDYSYPEIIDRAINEYFNNPYPNL